MKQLVIVQGYSHPARTADDRSVANMAARFSSGTFHWLRACLRDSLTPVLRRYPTLRAYLVNADLQLEQVRHSIATRLPSIIRPQPRRLEVAITAACNLRCEGCRYGRDFMPGAALTWPMVRDLLDDAWQIGIWSVRFYGGEPLLHPDLSRMVAHAAQLGMRPYVTTNAIRLREKIDELYAAGLRDLTIGFYGVSAAYDEYVQRKDQFQKVEDGIAAVRDRYGMNVSLRINWLLRRQTCNLEDLYAAYRFAERYATPIQIDLIHYSLPYFTEGSDRRLQFRPEDEPAIDRISAELVRLKERRPEMFTQSTAALRSIKDWVLKGPDMKVPCDAYQMVWVGADGTVQLCYVCFKLGNLREQRFRELMFTRQHRLAARDSFALNCPNCHCHYDTRVQKHAASDARYTAAAVTGIT